MQPTIVLRPQRTDDIDAEYVAWYDNADGHLDYFSGSGRRFDREVLVDDFEAAMRTGRSHFYIIETDSGERVGNVRIGPVDTVNRTSDLVCLIGNRAYVGKGLAAVAIRAANAIAFETHDIRRLQGGMLATNVPSIKAYTRAGWFVEATFRGFYWRAGEAVDRICVACLNPRYFPDAAG